jgi:hypothetical protein
MVQAPFLPGCDKTNFYATWVLPYSLTRGAHTGQVENFRKHFSRDKAGSWTCIEACAVDLPAGRIQVAVGTRLTRGTSFRGVDLAQLLDEYHDSIKPRTNH